ncbi:Trihelix transcription factor PTL [Acorus calamus]|uniref:Trihelix transcription factor PTL n=1 Tax=Acorus calamus TaxID=4465 RepID=A0AAV9EB02_ACOCL|nr:Trihelix transcription factor PTL [Acorus calamus]
MGTKGVGGNAGRNLRTSTSTTRRQGKAAGRQDGKHYRFFRQLDALYGDKQITLTPTIKDFNTNHSITTTTNHYHYFPTIPNNKPDAFQAAPELSESPSLSNHSSDDFLETSSSDKEDDRQRNDWRSKMMREFVDSQMRRFIEVQEAFLDKMLKTLENKVQERMLKEEVWKREETTRLKREHKLWAIEASLGGSSQRGSNAGFVKNHRG